MSNCKYCNWNKDICICVIEDKQAERIAELEQNLEESEGLLAWYQERYESVSEQLAALENSNE